jgi:hypothetical protein
MVSYGMLRRVVLVKTDVSEEPSAYFIRVTRIGELGTTLAATSNRRTLRNIPENTILQSHRRENLKSYTIYLLSLCHDFDPHSYADMRDYAFFQIHVWKT